jgi:hypothetical protein
MSEARTPEEDTIQTGDENASAEGNAPAEDKYEGPDPVEDEKGDGSDEDQGT